MGKKLTWDMPGVTWDDPRGLTWDGELPESGGYTMGSKLVHGVLTDANRDALIALINQAKALLPFAVDLTVEQRSNLPKTSDGSIAFVTEALSYAQQNVSALPADVDLAEFAADVALLLQLQVLQRVVDQFQELVSDTRLAVGSDAFTAGLDIYAMFKARGGGSGTALDAAKKSLGARFARGPYKKKTPPPAS